MTYFNVKEKLGRFFMANNGMNREQQLRSNIAEAEMLTDMTRTAGWKIFTTITTEKTERCIDLLSTNPENSAGMAGRLQAYREMHKEVVDRIVRGKDALAELEKLKSKEKSNARATANG